MLIPLVVVPDCQEHYENVRDMRELVDVKTVECVSESSDIKMILTEQGKQGGQCSAPTLASLVMASLHSRKAANCSLSEICGGHMKGK